LRRIILWLVSTVTAVVLLFSYRTSTMGVGTPSTATSAGTAPAVHGGAVGGRRYNGAVATTRWGDVQVIITVTDGKIIGVTVPVYPVAYVRDRIINARALPALIQATLTAQSADIDTVTGATATSEGYKESLQSAIDAAQLS
jgi:uncharacterized protein with FMN-binding domain